MLRVSDGVWSVRNIMRVNPVNGSATELIGQTITGQTSFATAIVTASVSFREAGNNVIELELDPATITGTFEENELVFGTSTITDSIVSFRPYSILTGTTVTNGGAYYTADQTINIASGGSNTATAKVQNVTRGVVDEIIVDTAGTGYAVGDDVVLDNSNTDGVGAVAEVSVVGGGIAPESGSLSAYGMNANDHITMEETSQNFYNDTYEGTKIVLETGTFTNLGVATQAGEITDVRMVGRGAGYSKLPVVTSITTTSGNGANLVAASNSNIGAIASFEIINQGLTYSSAPVLTPFRHAILTNISGTFTAGDNLTSHSGTVTAFDSARQLISLNTTANLVVGNSVTTAGASGTISNINIATGTAQVGTVALTSGNFLNSEGQLSEVIIRIQDSYYYQDYSYVIKVGQSINEWRDAIKSTVHPAGWAVFGEVEVVGRANAKISPQTVDSFTPELASLFKTLFITIFGRRLGTIDDGTSLKATPKVGSDNLTNFPNTNRDITLERINTIFVGVARTTSKSHGHTLDLLPKYAFAVPPTDTSLNIPHYPGIKRTATNNANNQAYFNIGQFANIRIDQVSDSNGNIPLQAFNTKINVPPPGAIIISGGPSINAFSNTFKTFDGTADTFDEDVAGTFSRQTAGSLFTSFDETTPSFDSTSTKFDVG